MSTHGSAAASFSVTIQPSGRTFSTSQDETLLAAGIRQNIGLPYGCKDGACGACKCKLLSGEVQHNSYQPKALSPEDRAAGYVLTCRAVAQTDLQLEARQVMEEGSFPVKKLPTRINTLRKLSDDVMLLQLQLPSNDVFQYHAGQYIDFLLRDGSRRSYSMANAVGAGPTLELHIRHMPGGKFTDQVFGSMKEKEILRIEGPFGSFYLREKSEQPIILLASGTGFAPIKAVLENMQQKDLARPTTLYWGGRRPTDLYLHDWIQAFAQTHPWLTYVPVISDTLPEDQWQGRSGFVHRAVLQDHPDLSGHQVYACGAPVMVDAAKRDFCAEAGLTEDQFFADAFTTQADLAAA
jgi:CDP-4-dehydro-6-deoxyglucose reductase